MDMKWKSIELEDSPSLTAPAVRMVIVLAWDADGATACRIYPVLAIQAAMVRRLSHFDDGRAEWNVPPSAGLAKDLGWHWVESEIDYTYVILDDEYGLTTPEVCLDAGNCVWQAFVADWPAAEDEARLAGEIAVLKVDASAKAAKWMATRVAGEESPPCR